MLCGIEEVFEPFGVACSLSWSDPCSCAAWSCCCRSRLRAAMPMPRFIWVTLNAEPCPEEHAHHGGQTFTASPASARQGACVLLRLPGLQLRRLSSARARHHARGARRPRSITTRSPVPPRPGAPARARSSQTRPAELTRRAARPGYGAVCPTGRRMAGRASTPFLLITRAPAEGIGAGAMCAGCPQGEFQ